MWRAYAHARDELRNWQSLDLRMALYQSLTWSPTNEVMSELSGFEITATGYSRTALTGLLREAFSGATFYSANVVDFGTLDPGQLVTALVLYVHVDDVDDSLNPTIAACFIDSIGTDAFDPFTVVFSGSYVFTLDAPGVPTS